MITKWAVNVNNFDEKYFSNFNIVFRPTFKPGGSGFSRLGAG
jgi:hypothetical protein